MAVKLTCEIRPRLDAVSADAWHRLFPDLPDSVEMIQFIQDCGVPGFAVHSIVVRDGAWPILLLPLFETTYRLSSFVDAGAKRFAEAITNGLPFLGQMRLLGVGFVESEWGQVGVDRRADRAALEAAWDLALKALEALAQGLKADVTAFVNFTTQSGRMLPMARLRRFGQIPGLPFAQTRILYAQPEHYLASLSANMRSSLRRKLRKAQEVRVLRTREPGPWLDAIYQFYLDTYRRSPVQFSRQPKEFFAWVCRRIMDAEYALYFIGERVAAFRLQIIRPDGLIDKYFGMDPVLGREYSLYFVSWYKDIAYCIANQIRLYHSGLTEEETKVRLGARLIPSQILFRHRHPLSHRMLVALARHLAYQPAVPVPPVRLGTDWEGSRELPTYGWSPRDQPSSGRSGTDQQDGRWCGLRDPKMVTIAQRGPRDAHREVVR